MKKLITGAVASLALLFGFASCSGDLHDNDVQPLTITGLCGTAVVPMELVNADGSLQKLTFKVSEDTKIKSLDSKNPEYALKDGWGGISNINFKLIPSDAVGANYEPTWSMDFGGPKDNPLYLTATKSESYTQLKSRAEFSSGFPSNIFISGAIVNEEYTIWAKYNAASQSCYIWVSGAASDPAEIRLIAGNDSKNFPAKDNEGKDLTYKMEKAGSAYTYTFIAKADETLNLSFENDLAGILSEDLTLTTVKNVEYKITIDVSKGISAPTVKSDVVDMLKDATIKANWKYADWESAFEEKFENKKYQFIAERNEIDFVVLRHNGIAWAGKTLAVDGGSAELTYSSDEKISVKSLKVGTCYQINFIVNNDSFSLKAEIIEVPLADYSNSDLVGDMGNGGLAFTKDKDGNFYVDFTYLDSWKAWGGGSGKLVFAIRFEAGQWNGQSGYSYFSSASLPEGYEYINNSNNPAIKGMVDGQKYRIIFIPGYGAASFTLEVLN